MCVDADKEKRRDVTVGLNIFLVGGAVRDQLLGLPQHERDWVVVNASEQRMLEAGFMPVGRDFPVFIHPHSKEEYALARSEKKTAPGYHGFSFDTSKDVTLEEDLRRRDLTINAMARDRDGQLIDPWGGQADLKKKLLRHVSEAFSEDPVRIARTARFAAKLSPLGFTVAAATMDLMRTMVASGEAHCLVPERLWLEFSKAWQEPQPSAFLQTLNAVGALKIFAPQLAQLFADASRQQTIATSIDQAAQHKSQLVFPALALACAYYQQSLLPFCKRMKSASRYCKIAQHAETIMHSIKHNRAYAQDVLTALEKTDAFRNPQRLNTILDSLTCCDAVIKDSRQWASLFKRALQQVQKVKLRAVVEQCAHSRDIEAAVHAARLKALLDK